MKKKLVWLVVAAAVILGGVYFYTTQRGSKQDENVIKIGAILPLTGTGSVTGEYLKDGIDFALMNQNKIKIIYEDSKSLPNQGVLSYKKLVDIDKADVCIVALSSVVMSIVPIIDTKLPVLSTLTTYPDITEKSPLLFRHFINSTSEAKIMASFIKSNKNYSSVAVVYNNDEGGIGSKKAFEEDYLRQGGEILYEESYPADRTDFKSIIIKLKEKKEVDAIYIIGYGNSLGLFVKQIREFGITKPVFTMSQFGSADARNSAGIFAKSIIYTSPEFNFYDNGDKTKFVDDFKQHYSKEPNFINAFGYEMGLLIFDAINKKKTSDIDWKTALQKAETIGLDGRKLSFDERREVETRMNIVEWDGEKEVKLY